MAVEDAEGIHLVQELAPGGDLYQFLAGKGGRLPEEQVRSLVIRPLLEALAYLHSMVRFSKTEGLPPISDYKPYLLQPADSLRQICLPKSKKSCQLACR